MDISSSLVARAVQKAPSHSNLVDIPPNLLILISHLLLILQYVNIVFSGRPTRLPCSANAMSTVKLEQAGAWHIHQCQHCQHMARDSSSVCPYYCAVFHGTWRTHSGTQRTHLSVSPLCPHGELHMCVSDPPCVTVNCECKYHRYSSSSDICVSTFHLPELMFENDEVITAIMT